ncbi:MAG: hypothetical protein AAF586_00995 [Planctomycetota bacterium]
MSTNGIDGRRGVMHSVRGEPSWRLSCGRVTLAVTEAGGHIAPVTFRTPDHPTRPALEPLSLAPWAEEQHPPDLPTILRVLRGDFFCMPFGSNDATYHHGTGPETHPIHGETANRHWTWEDGDGDDNEAWMRLSMLTRIRPGTVTKTVRLVADHPVVYQRHVVTGLLGPMCFGHHAMLKFDDDEIARLSFSDFDAGRVYPGPFEDEANGGRQSLAPGAWFDDLAAVPRLDGTTADLTTYPARPGYEDLVQLASARDTGLAWAAAAVAPQGDPTQPGGWLWFALKNPAALRSTVLWHSNGGRDYAPWNARHTRVLGIEDTTSFFHDGLAGSVGENEWRDRGVPTVFNLRPDRPFTIPYAFGCVPRPAGFTRVASIEPAADGVVLTDEAGASCGVPIDLDWLTQAGDS